MPFDYAQAAADAQELLAEFGQRVTLTRDTAGTYDPVTGEETGGGSQTQTAWAVLLDYNLQDSGARFADGSQVAIGDKNIIIEAKGLAWPPDALTTLTDSTGRVWQLEKVRELAPAGSPAVLYKANGTR